MFLLQEGGRSAWGWCVSKGNNGLRWPPRWTGGMSCPRGPHAGLTSARPRGLGRPHSQDHPRASETREPHNEQASSRSWGSPSPSLEASGARRHQLPSALFRGLSTRSWKTASGKLGPLSPVLISVFALFNKYITAVVSKISFFSFGASSNLDPVPAKLGKNF